MTLLRPGPAAALPVVTPGIAPADLQALRAGLRGTVLTAGDPAYETARRGHNLVFDRHPAVIVRPADATDVSRAVLTARELGLEIAVKGGGHSVAGHSVNDGGMVIDLADMRAIEIDPIRRLGTAQGGVTAGEYTVAAHQRGFATPFGDTGNVGLGGLTLGGGIGWLVRKHGLTIDSLESVDLVTADGRFTTVSADHDPDLFWALRGGGGNFGIATRFQYRLHPVDMVTAGMIALPLSRDVLRGLVGVSLAAPEALSQITFVMGLPPAPFVPAELVGTPAVVVMPVHAGDAEAGAAAVAPFRALAKPLVDMVAPMPYPAIYGFTADAAEAGKSVVRSNFLRTLDDGAIDAMVERHASSEARLAITQLRVFGGAMARVPAGATAFAHRDATVMATVISGVADSYETTAAWADAYLRDLSATATGVYSNFLDEEGASRLHRAYPGATYERLVAVKRRVDPSNVFRGNHNIDPS